ncbi:MAG: hypothetical protein EA420_03420 [Candidatus Competibacteraceae bacterium]|nr:MAG: hypothetical protein EA420_03420 [Candidatus Competibacteraceae bacterium]
MVSRSRSRYGDRRHDGLCLGGDRSCISAADHGGVVEVEMSVNSLIDGIIRREGGYVNHPADRGGPTKYGITAATLGSARGNGRAATAGEVQLLTMEEARAIYWHQYVARPNFDQIRDDYLQEVVVDFAVHSGPRRAAEALQRAVGVRVDGIVGPMTLAAVNARDAEKTALRVMLDRALFLLDLVGRDRSQAVFARGWANRLLELRDGGSPDAFTAADAPLPRQDDAEEISEAARGLGRWLANLFGRRK